MFLIVGLGNPDTKYKSTRHNAGFMALDQIQENWRTMYNFTDWQLSQKFNSHLSEGMIGEKKIILAKPTTYMNGSGIAVRKLSSFYKPALKDIVIIHDDFDIPLGEIKPVFGRGPAGHNGIKSIIATLGTKNFSRIRIGIKPTGTELPKKSLDTFALENFTNFEQENIGEAIGKTVKEVEGMIQ